MIKTILLNLFLFLSISVYSYTVKKGNNLMGSRFELIVVHPDSLQASLIIDEAFIEIEKIENRISSWINDSEISQINAYSGIKPIKVSPSTFQLLKRCVKVSLNTQGAFQITSAVLKKYWSFNTPNFTLPLTKEIAIDLPLIGDDKIQFNNKNYTVYLPLKGMKIGLGAIGKGYAAEETKRFLMQKGIVSGVVNAGGDVLAWGHPEKEPYWKIGIANPLDKTKSIGFLSIENNAVVTSGDYERFVWIKGKKYSHILNPKTGYPCHKTRSVTVVCPNAELADALATSLFVMGTQKAISWVNQQINIECLIIDKDGQIIKSTGFYIHSSNDKKKQ